MARRDAARFSARTTLIAGDCVVRDVLVAAGAVGRGRSVERAVCCGCGSLKTILGLFHTKARRHPHTTMMKKAIPIRTARLTSFSYEKVG